MQDEARKDELDTEEPSSRSQFLKIAGGTGAAGALALFIAACGGDDETSSELQLQRRRPRRPAPAPPRAIWRS